MRIEVTREKDVKENPQGFYYLIVINKERYAADTPEHVGRIIIEKLG